MARSSSSHHPAWRAQHGVCVCVCRAQRGPSGSERIMHAGRVPSIARIDDGMMHGACAWHAARGTAPLALTSPDQTAWRQSPSGTAGNACRARARQRLLVCRREQRQAAVDNGLRATARLARAPAPACSPLQACLLSTSGHAAWAHQARDAGEHRGRVPGVSRGPGRACIAGQTDEWGPVRAPAPLPPLLADLGDSQAMAIEAARCKRICMTWCAPQMPRGRPHTTLALCRNGR